MVCSSDLQQDPLPGRQTDQGDEQDTGHRAPPDGRSGPGQVAGDTANDEDPEHREQRPDAAANAQPPTARPVGPCHRTRAGEHEEPDCKGGRAERGRPVPRRKAPPHPATSAAVSRARRTAVTTAAAAAPETSSRALRRPVTAPGPRALPHVAARPAR